MEKWGLQGEISEFDLKNAARSYARIKIRNRSLKWITILSIIYLIVLLGLMIGSVVIGVKITKDLKTNDDKLVTVNGKNNIIKTSQAMFPVTLSLLSPLDVIRNVKTINFEINSNSEDKGVYHMNIVSFYFISGYKLEFYGHNYLARLDQNSKKFKI